MTDRFEDDIEEVDAFEEDYEPTVSLDMDDGSQVDCEILAVFPSGERDYIALLPVTGEDAGKNTVYIFRFYEDADGNPRMENIEDDAEYDQAAAAFDAFMESDDEPEDYDDTLEEDFDKDAN